MEMEIEKAGLYNALGGVIFILFVVGIIVVGMWAFPKYRIYSQDMKGQATLRQQEWEKRVRVEEARAQKDAAILEAEAEIERSKGVAEANRIVADSLKDNEGYLRYLWIDKVAGKDNLIYVPTEAGLPVLEATRLLGE